jgi:hypothetical protein
LWVGAESPRRHTEVMMMRTAVRVYKSSKQALAWFFEASRDKWKARCRELRELLRGQAAQVAQATRERDAWRAKAETALQCVAECESQVSHWRAQYEAESKKTAQRLARGRG